MKYTDKTIVVVCIAKWKAKNILKVKGAKNKVALFFDVKTKLREVWVL